MKFEGALTGMQRTDMLPPPPTPEQQDRQQAERERRNVEQYCATAIRAHERLLPDAKAYLEAHVKGNYGQWQQCDGEGMVADGFSYDEDRGVVIAYFKVYMQDEEGRPITEQYEEVTDEIPVPEGMPLLKQQDAATEE